MDPLLTVVAWMVTVLLAGVGGFWLRARSDRRDSKRLNMEIASNEKSRIELQRADVRARLEFQQSLGDRKHVVVVFSNVGKSPAREVEFEVTSIHNRGCHVIWAPVHVPIPVLLPGQEYPVGGSLSDECSQPLLVEIEWVDELDPNSIEIQITADLSK